MVGLDLSQPAAAQNTYWTLNSLFSVITRNITDGALRFQGFAAPSLSAAGAGSIYFDSSSNTFKLSQNGGAYADIHTGTITVPQGGTGLASLTTYAILAGGTSTTGNVQQVSGLGSTGQVLTSNGAGTLPSWQTVATGGISGAVIGNLLRANSTTTGTDSGIVSTQAANSVSSRYNVLDYATLAAAVTAIGATAATLVIPSVVSIASNLTIPSTLILEFTNTGSISIPNAVTLAINSEVATSRRRIFTLTGTGAVQLTRTPDVYAEWFGAVGDNLTDCYASITAAVASIAGNGVVSLGIGTFLTSASISVNRGVVIRGAIGANVATNASLLIGNFSGYLLNFTLGGIAGGAGVSNLYLYNAHAAGGGVYFENVQSPASVQDCWVTAYRGITCHANTFSVLIKNTNCLGVGNPTNGWGIYACGHTNIVSVDIVGHDHGIRASGAGLTIAGGRFEVNKSAIVLGLDDSGAQIQSTGVCISGLTCEANDTAIWLQSAAAFVLAGISIQGSVNSPSGQSVYGIRSTASGRGMMSGITVGGTFSVVALQAHSNTAFTGVAAAGNSLGFGWDVARPDTCTFTDTDYNLLGTSAQLNNLTSTQFLRSIAAADQTRTPVPGYNLRGISIAVSAAATTATITFPNLSSGQAAINTATATGSGATLPNNTYYYIATLVNEIGETAATAEQTVTTTGTQQVDITFFGLPAAQKQWRRRIYRGTASGVYDGYFEMAVESSATFSDTGQAFSGEKSPPSTGDAVGTEADTNYAIVVTPAWDTTVRVTAKGTGSFDLAFGTAAPGGGSTFDWMMMR